MFQRKQKLALSVLGLFLVISGLFLCGNRILQNYQRTKSFNSLRISIEKLTDDYPGIDCVFLIKDLKFRNAVLADNKKNKFPAASLLKLPILASALNAINEKQIALDDSVIINKKDIVGGSGKLKKCQLPYKLTFNELLELMISASDNTATNKTIQILGFDYINDQFIKIGLKDTYLTRLMMDFSQRKNGIDNYTSSRDIALILEKIYDQRLASRSLSKLAIAFLKKQKVNDRLPRYLPKNTVIAHKTGLEKGVVHDAGIVFAPQGSYIICVLTKNSKEYQKSKKLIAQISLLAYNLYQ